MKSENPTSQYRRLHLRRDRHHPVGGGWTFRNASRAPDIGTSVLSISFKDSLPFSLSRRRISFARDYHPLGTYAIRSLVCTYPRFRSGVLLRETWRYPHTWVISARHSTSRVAPRVHDRRHFRLSRLNKPPPVVFHEGPRHVREYIFQLELVA